MSNNKSIRITVASCLLFVSMVAGLFVYTTVSPKELTAAEYKQIGFYKLVRTRQINNFELIEGTISFLIMISREHGIYYFLVLHLVLICAR